MAMADLTGIVPTVDLNGGNNDAFGGGSSWVLLLFFLLAMGGTGFGGNGNQKGEISNDFLYTNLNNDLNTDFIQVYQQNQALSKDLCNGFSTTNLNMNNGFNSVNTNINSISREMAECCCQTNRNIDSVKFENERNTNAIIQNATANTQAILDKMCQNEIQSLRDQLNETRRQADICRQNDILLSYLRPTPVPAYITCSPYASASTSGCCNLG